MPGVSARTYSTCWAGNVVGRFRGALDRVGVELAVLLHARRRPTCHHRRAGHAMRPANDVAAGVQPGADPVVIIRPVRGRAGCPPRASRSASPDSRRACAICAACAMLSMSSRRPKAPPIIWLCTTTCSALAARSRRPPRPARASAPACRPRYPRRPARTWIVVVDRLHRRVRQERQLVDDIKALRRGLDRGRRVAFGFRHHACGSAMPYPSRARCPRWRVGVRPVVPDRRGGCQTLLRGPHVIADHRHCVVEANHVAHAGHAACGGLVDADRSLPPGTGLAATVPIFMPGTCTSMP